jgi:hypothetical protein
MKELSIIILLSFFSVSLYSQHRFEVKNDDFSVEYQVDKGKLHGKYISYYPNGTKKVEGEFYKNQRIGIWTMWSEEGEALLQRDYSNNFVFLHPENNPNDLAYVPYRNDSEYFEYFKLQENHVLFSKRMMSVILPENNAFLFPAKELLTLLSDNQDNKAFQQIQIQDDFSIEPMDLPEVANSEIIAYKLLQEAVYDSERQIMEIRPVFICPVIYNDVEDTIYEDNWLSYQLIYPYMHEIALAVSESDMEIFSMADVFFWQYYDFYFLKFDNALFSWSDNLVTIDAPLFNSEGELEKPFFSASWETRIQLIEKEHDLWSKFYNE